jgi:hypothetical protein
MSALFELRILSFSRYGKCNAQVFIRTRILGFCWILVLILIRVMTFSGPTSKNVY